MSDIDKIMAKLELLDARLGELLMELEKLKNVILGQIP